MLRLNDIVKIYKTGDIEVRALKGINLAFRKNEFVSILGPSGCGKTTLLNIIGGLDKYSSGDLVISGISTKKFKDKDWDSYRNHKIGFIFQSYNLIPHQTILGNVELALTIGGYSKAEREKKAKEALDKVGLKGLYKKKPNQLSGGQCQRVAIARALVNEPDILLADEPTGALDTETSIQIMELIKEISKEKLVIMVTHNPDLAYKYSSRIVKILDGNILDDSNPYSLEEEAKEVYQENNSIGKSKMSWWTAFKLSGRNLLTKYKRTLLTCFAGSIGIVGICSVLAVSSGVKGYIYNMQDDMLSGNPITIEESGYNLTSIMNSMSTTEKLEAVIKNGIVNVDSLITYIASMVDSEDGMLINNDIDENYVNYLKDMPKDYYNSISFRYGVNLANNIYTDYTSLMYNDETKKMEETKREVSISGINSIYTSVLQDSEQFGDYAQMITALTSPLMQSLPDEEYLLEQYDVKQGKIATEKNEMMIVVNSKQELVDLVLAQLGYYTQEEFVEMAMKYNDKDYQGKLEFTFDELMNKKFTYYPNDSIFAQMDYDSLVKQIDEILKITPDEFKDKLLSLRNFIAEASPFLYRNENNDKPITVNGMTFPGTENFKKFENGLELEVVGILMPKEGRMYSSLQSGFYYTEDLVEYSIAANKDSAIIKYAKEEAAKDPNSKGNYVFGVQDATSKTIKYHIPSFYEYTPQIDEGESLDKNFTKVTPSILTSGGGSSFNSMINQMMGGNTAFGPEMRELSGKDVPNGVRIYPNTFEEKYLVTDYLDKWNQKGDITLSDGTILTFEDRQDIEYQDNLEMVITMINGMVDMITIALICFTSLALVVSCVMIAIITYVSVMERIKEIGIIRALGGRKRDVSNLFNAETIVIGTLSGLLGVGISYILSIIVNIIVYNLTGVYPISDLLWIQAVVMLAISIILTTISGFIPARSASKKDPVVALRTE